MMDLGDVTIRAVIIVLITLLILFTAGFVVYMVDVNLGTEVGKVTCTVLDKKTEARTNVYPIWIPSSKSFIYYPDTKIRHMIKVACGNVTEWIEVSPGQYNKITKGQDMTLTMIRGAITGEIYLNP